MKYHTKDYEYKRLLEIIDDYWLSEKDEEFVEIQMRFRHHNGMEQRKTIKWENERFRRTKEQAEQ